MSNVALANVLRWIGLILLQVLVLKRMDLAGGIFQYVHVMLYVLFILLLPIRLSGPVVMFLAFATGLVVDIFYDSFGVHASAAVFVAFIRPIALNLLEPREGYNVNYSPTKKKLGLGWFVQYSAILIFAFLFFYFSVEAFTFVYIGNIFLKTIASFIATMAFILIYVLIFDPEY